MSIAPVPGSQPDTPEQAKPTSATTNINGSTSAASDAAVSRSNDLPSMSKNTAGPVPVTASAMNGAASEGSGAAEPARESSKAGQNGSRAPCAAAPTTSAAAISGLPGTTSTAPSSADMTTPGTPQVAPSALPASLSAAAPNAATTGVNTAPAASMGASKTTGSTSNGTTAESASPGKAVDGSNVQGPTADAASTPKAASTKARTPRQPAKQRRKTNQPGAKGTEPLHTGPSTVGGTIGAAPDHAVPAMIGGGGGGRKALPEHVLPYALPCSSVRPESPLLNTATPAEREAFLKRAKLNDGSRTGTAPIAPPAAANGQHKGSGKAAPVSAGRSVSRQIKQPSVEMSDSSDSDTFSSVSDSDEDDEERLQRREERKRKREPANVGDSLVLHQSLRQSRLSHLSSLLPPFSQKVRSGMIYPNVLPLSLLHGLNPRDPHVLIQLGRADIQVGPHIFVKTKFWEVRPDVDLANTGPAHIENYTGPYGEVKRTAIVPVSAKLEQKSEQLVGDKPQRASPGVSAAVKSPAAKAQKGEKAGTETAVTQSNQRRPSTPLQPIAPKPSGNVASKAELASAAPNTSGVAAASVTSSTPLTGGTKLAAGATAAAPATTAASSTAAPSEPQRLGQHTAQPPTASRTAAPVSDEASKPSDAPSVAAVPSAAKTGTSSAPTAAVAAGAAPRQPAAPVATRPQHAAKPAPPAASSAIAPPRPATIGAHALATTTGAVAGNIPVPATTVSQHVQFAPARLSPISQPSSQQSAARSNQSTPPSASPAPAGGSAKTAPASKTASAVSSPAAVQTSIPSSAAPVTSGAGAKPAIDVARPAAPAATATPTPVQSSVPKLAQPATATTGLKPIPTPAKAPVPGSAPAAGASAATSLNPSPARVAQPGAAAPRPTPGPAAPRPPQPSSAAPRPPQPGAPQPAIDAVLVSRVNATAALNPELQQLLHVAASGKANPEQLKSLGVWIQAITAQLREDEARAAASGGAAGGSKALDVGGNAAGSAKSKSKGKAKDAGGPTAASAGSSGAGGTKAPASEKPKKPKKSKPDAEELQSLREAKKAAKVEEREAKKKAAAAAKAEAKAAAAAQKLQQQKLQQQQQQQERLRQLPPGWPTEGPPRPPIIVVEFRENPSMRFVLPLWKCVVERREGLDPASMPKIKRERGFFDDFLEDDSEDEEVKGIEPELKLSFFVPSVGSDAAGDSGNPPAGSAEAAQASRSAAIADPGTASADSATSSPSAGMAAATHGQKKPPKKTQKKIDEELKARAQAEAAEQEKRHEQFPATWSISGGVTESMWEAFGRVPGAITNAVVRPVKPEPEIELAPDVAEFLVPEIKYHLLDQSEEEMKIHKDMASGFVDLYNQMPDRRFVMPCIAPMHIPLGLDDHLTDKFAIRPQMMAARPVAKRKAGRDEVDLVFAFGGNSNGNGQPPLTVSGSDLGGGPEIKTEAEPTPTKPPKRKRHVATHNPDGSIKSCGACGKTKTPMWRRGPKGPSQLCNACGARWKAGRLVVPEVAPPPIIESEADAKTKADIDKSQDEQSTSQGHGQDGEGVSMGGAVFIPMGASAAAMSMPATTFAPVTGIDMNRLPFATPSTASGLPLSGVVSSSSAYQPHHLPLAEVGFGSSFNMGLAAPNQPGPSPFIRSPDPFSGHDSMPASVDPSVLFGGGGGGF